MSSSQRSESLRPSLTEAKGSEAQGRGGDGASESSVEQNCGPMNKNLLRGAKGGRAGKWPRSPPSVKARQRRVGGRAAKTGWLIRDGYDWVVDLDLEAFFDHVNHDRLMSRLDMGERIGDYCKRA